jgi:hypothetical protein
MSRVYRVVGDRRTVSMTRLHCRSEEKELQNLLEANLQLIPGEQINPEEPRRWLLLKGELPVEDPATGENRWSLDFLLLDQEAVLTLVECKRFRDVRAKREVIGQMLHSPSCAGPITACGIRSHPAAWPQFMTRPGWPPMKGRLCVCGWLKNRSPLASM